MHCLKKMKLLHSIVKSNFGLVRKPFKLNFAITYKCNSQCKTCNIWKKKPVRELSLGEIKEIFSKAPFLQWISLTGGEPFLRKDLSEIVEAISSNCPNLFVLTIPTNGSLTDRIIKTTEKICSSNIPKIGITVSLDGPREVNDKIRGVKKSWNKSIETFKELQKIRKKNKKLEVFFEFTLSPFNIGLFKRTFLEAKKEIPGLKPLDLNATIFHYSHHYYANEPVDNNYREFLKKISGEIGDILKLRRAKSINPSTLLTQAYLKLAKNGIEERKFDCQAMKASCFLDPSGNLYPCIMLNEKIGNLRQYNYDIIKCLNSENAMVVKDNVGQCPRICWTQCEANQAMLANLPKMLVKTLF